MCEEKKVPSLICELTANTPVNSFPGLISSSSAAGDIFTLRFSWNGPAPRAGQFFMVKPQRGSVFLARPLSVCEYNPADSTVKFLVSRRGKGTEELNNLRAGEKAELIGPLGNAWADFLPESGKAALIGGGIGIAPLISIVAEKPERDFHFYAGFKRGFRDKEEEASMLGAAVKAKKIIITAEDSWNPLRGLITDFFDEKDGFNVVFACGPVPMLKAVKKKCDNTGLPLFLSLEKRMACGAGACLGCTVHTVNGNRRCCADGPIFAAQELLFDE